MVRMAFSAVEHSRGGPEGPPLHSLLAGWLTSARMRIRRSRRHRSRRVAAAHRTHIARSEAGHASARCYTQLRWTRPAAHRSTLRLHRKELPVGIAGHSHTHPRHIVGNVKRLLALASLNGALAGRFGLRLVRAHIQPPAIRRRRARILLQLLLHSIMRFRNRWRRRTSRSGSLVA